MTLHLPTRGDAAGKFPVVGDYEYGRLIHWEVLPLLKIPFHFFWVARDSASHSGTAAATSNSATSPLGIDACDALFASALEPLLRACADRRSTAGVEARAEAAAAWPTSGPESSDPVSSPSPATPLPKAASTEARKSRSIRNASPEEYSGW